jgi:hypothetical protein
MAYPCDKYTYYYQNTLTPGPGLLNQSFYVGSNGGAVQDGYYSDGSYVYTVVSGIVTSVVTVGDCGTLPTPTPIQYYEYNFAYAANAVLACSKGTDPGQLTTLYSNANSSDLYGPSGIVNYSPQSDVYTFGYYLYTDTGLSSPVSNGYYSDGIYYFRVNGSGATAGLITAAGYC